MGDVAPVPAVVCDMLTELATALRHWPIGQARAKRLPDGAWPLAGWTWQANEEALAERGLRRRVCVATIRRLAHLTAHWRKGWRG